MTYETIKKNIVELLGWYGATAIVLGYALVSFSVVEPTSIMLQALNATGALGIVMVSFSKKAYQPGVLNLIWMTIALVTIARALAP